MSVYVCVCVWYDIVRYEIVRREYMHTSVRREYIYTHIHTYIHIPTHIRTSTRWA
jgi:hypothetical protein